MKKKIRTSIMKFVKKVKILGQLKHPNIVVYKESFRDNEKNVFIVMSHCEQGDLHTKIHNKNDKLFPENFLTDWIAQMLLAIHFLHDNKILHRDIKSQNIFLSNNRVILGDFGISKCLENTRDLANSVK